MRGRSPSPTADRGFGDVLDHYVPSADERAQHELILRRAGQRLGGGWTRLAEVGSASRVAVFRCRSRRACSEQFLWRLDISWTFCCRHPLRESVRSPPRRWRPEDPRRQEGRPRVDPELKRSRAVQGAARSAMGSPTSSSCRPGRAGSTWPRSSTASRAAWSVVDAGRPPSRARGRCAQNGGQPPRAAARPRASQPVGLAILSTDLRRDPKALTYAGQAAPER